MRQGIWRALLVLALLVPLSRLSFGDTFAVSGNLDASGDTAGGHLSGPSFTFEGGSGEIYGIFGCCWIVGASVQPSWNLILGDYGIWTLNGLSGIGANGIFDFYVTDPFTVGSLGATGIPITWTGQIDLFDGLYIDLSGVGTASFTGRSEAPDVPGGIFLLNTDTDVTGEALVTPEPSTLTLMGIAGIASIVVIGFRRRYSNA